MELPVLLDGAVATLLLITIGYCVVLYARLNEVRKSNTMMKKLMTEFTSATERAQAGLLSIKSTGSELSNALSERIDEARALKGDLVYVTQAAQVLAERLDVALDERTPSAVIASKPSVKPRKNGAASGKAMVRTSSESERELMAALQQAR
ncbi:MAG: hypothetical protein HQ495_13070 [Alphaproteobacteria bacterium]|nr:hypothetical protein [Alphaproteobacteria bacterium]